MSADLYGAFSYGAFSGNGGSAGGYSVSGGAGGVSARLDDMESKADQLDRIAKQMAATSSGSLLAHSGVALEVGALVSPMTWVEVKRSMAAFDVYVVAAVTRLEATAVSLRAAVRGYREAERAAEWVVDQAITALGNFTGHVVRIGLIVVAPSMVVGAAFLVLAPVVFLDAALTTFSMATGGNYSINMTRALARGGARTAKNAKEALADEAFENPGFTRRVVESFIPGFTAGFVGVPPGVRVLSSGTREPDELVNMTVKAGQTSGLLSHHVTVTKKSTTTTSEKQVSNLSELYARERTTAAGRANGQVRVDTVVGADGKERVVVYVPPTTDWGVGGENTSDMQTNLETLSGNDSAMRAVVRQALADAGVDSDTEVMLVGYSQGGIVSMSLASDEDFTAQYNVTTVVTVGSPVSDFEVSDDLEVLSIEHDQDVVPQLDGSVNPDQFNWTTVTTTPDLEPGQSPQDAHGGDVYAQAIAGVEDDPAVQAFKDKRGEFFSGTIVESSEYEGLRK